MAMLGAEELPDAAVAAEGELPPQPPASAAAAAASDEDAGLDAAAFALDEHSKALRTDLLARLLEWKRQVGEREQAARAAAEADATAQLAAKQHDLDAACAHLAHQEEVVKRMGHSLFKAARWRRQLTLGCTAWRAWRVQAHRQQQRSVVLQAALRHYEVNRLQRRVLLAWRAAAAQQRAAKVKALMVAAAEAERHRQDAAAAAAQQAQRLADVEAELTSALAARAELEQGMKRAFMRGVCALNIEAMALMKGGPGHGADGASVPPEGQQQQQQQQRAHQQLSAISAPPAAGQPPASNLRVEEQQLLALLMQKAGRGGNPGPAASSAAGMNLAEASLTGDVAQQHRAGGVPSQWQLRPGAGGSVAASWPQQVGGPPAANMGAAFTHGASPAHPHAEWPLPLVSIAPTKPVSLTVLPPNGHNTPAAVRHTGASGHPPRPATAVAPMPCSLPSNVPPQMAAILAGAGRSVACASPSRPTTAPTRRQTTVGLATPVGAGPPPLQVSRRSVAGQQRGAGVAPGTGGVKPLVVRGAVSETQAPAWRSSCS